MQMHCIFNCFVIKLIVLLKSTWVSQVAFLVSWKPTKGLKDAFGEKYNYSLFQDFGKCEVFFPFKSFQVECFNLMHIMNIGPLKDQAAL